MADFPKVVLDKAPTKIVMAISVVATSFVLRSLMVQLLGFELPPFITLYPAIMVVALLGGFWPGMLGTALGMVGVDYLIFVPRGHFEITDRGDGAALAFFGLMSIFVSLVAERYRRGQEQIAAFERERAQHEADARYHDLFNTMEEGVGVFEMIFDAAGKVADFRVVEVNPGFERQSGLKNAAGRRMREIAPGLEEFWFEFYGDVARTGEPAHVVHGSDAVAGVYDVRAYRVGMPEERRVAAVFKDISDRIREERALREQAELIELAQDAIMVRDMDGSIRSWNQGSVAMYGFTKEEAVGKNVHKLLSTVFPMPVAELYALLLKEGWWEGELHHTSRDGRDIVVDSRWAVQRDKYGLPSGVLEINTDITERKQAEKHIHQLNRVYTVLSDVNQTIVREKDPLKMMQSACRIAVDKGGFRMAWVGMIEPESELLKPVAWGGLVEGYLEDLNVDLKDPVRGNGPAGQSIRTGNNIVCNDIAKDEMYAPWRETALERGYLSSAAFPLRTDEEIVGVFNLYAAEPEFFAGDEIALLDEMAMDISHALEVYKHDREREKADEELRWRTAFFEAMVESSVDSVIVVDKEGKKILQNRRVVEMLGIPPEIAADPEFAHQIAFVMPRIKDAEGFVERVGYLSSHADEISRDQIEFLDGKILDRYSSPVRDAAGNYYGRIWTLRDVTEQREMEDHFRQAQKMEAVGQLTGGIAHDFNNLLTVILGCSEFIGREVASDERLSKMAGMVVNAAKRGADLTHRMLAFARRQALEPRTVDVQQLLTEMEGFLRRTLTAEIDLKIVRGEGEPLAIVDPAQLENAVLNLCVNARDAMPGGGTLTVEAMNADLDESYAGQNPGVSVGQYILIVVSDNGCGISPEHLERVFDPFFTTKPAGKGTGLGLSMVYGFAKQSQGHVKIYSEVGRGTSVRLYLPKALDTTWTPSEPVNGIVEIRGSETILLVEDNEPVLEFARGQLVDLGYRVLVANCGRDALEVLKGRADIDLLFTDMVMPGGMNGHELAMEAMKMLPKLRVLFSSGYAENAIAHQGLLERGVHLLQKPYTRLDLGRMVRRALSTH